MLSFAAVGPMIAVDTVVNRGRPPARWVVVLRMAWHPASPTQAGLRVLARPAHPSLPAEAWSVPLTLLERAIVEPVSAPGLNVRPDPARRRVHLDLDAARPWSVTLPTDVIVRFLAAVRTAAAVHAPGG